MSISHQMINLDVMALRQICISFQSQEQHGFRFEKHLVIIFHPYEQLWCVVASGVQGC